jgi:uncharacterized OsmC-like protein
MDIKLKHKTGHRERVARLTRADDAYRYDTEVESGHVVRTDEGSHTGGTGGAPTSLETLTASLASCQAVQVVRVAEAMRYRLEDLEITCTTTSDKEPGLPGNDQRTRINSARLNIGFGTDETEKRTERLKELAVDRCPIGRLFDQAGIAPEIHWTVRSICD